MGKKNHDIETAYNNPDYLRRLWKDLDLLGKGIPFPFSLHRISLNSEASTGAVAAVVWRDGYLLSPNGFLITSTNQDQAEQVVRRARMALAAMSTIRNALGIRDADHWFLKKVASRAQHEVVLAIEQKFKNDYETLQQIAYRFVENGIDICIPKKAERSFDTKCDELVRMSALSLLRGTLVDRAFYSVPEVGA